MRRPSLRVFITGASSGLGAALARHYAAHGAQLGLVARRAELLAHLAKELPIPPEVYGLDVCDATALQNAAEDFIARHGLPDIVIANAGVSAGTLTEETQDAAVFARILQVNLLGMVHTFQPFVAAMHQASAGHLVGIASVAGIRGLPGAGAYCASKAAAITYLESLRVELHGSGVKVSTILPGYVDTPMTAVNPYPMPFMLPAPLAAQSIAKHIERGASYAVVPWKMGLVARLLRLLPNRLYDRIFAHAGRKPRGLPV